MLSILLLSGSANYSQMFTREPFGWKTETVHSEASDSKIENSDIICFTGGPDVHPSYYGQTPIQAGPTSPGRDKQEMDAYYKALALGKPMIGICRGAQFLNVMNGGELIQHVSGHTYPHEIRTHDGKHDRLRVTSTHHQMMVAHSSAKLLAWAEGLATEHVVPEGYKPRFSVDKQGRHKEPEALWYEMTKCLCVQYHPETMAQYHHYHIDHFVSLVTTYILGE